MKQSEAMTKRLEEIRIEAEDALKDPSLNRDPARFNFLQGKLHVVADVLGFIDLKKVDGEIEVE